MSLPVCWGSLKHRPSLNIVVLFSHNVFLFIEIIDGLVEAYLSKEMSGVNTLFYKIIMRYIPLGLLHN